MCFEASHSLRYACPLPLGTEPNVVSVFDRLNWPGSDWKPILFMVHFVPACAQTIWFKLEDNQVKIGVGINDLLLWAGEGNVGFAYAEIQTQCGFWIS